MRHTKILATLGPSTETSQPIKALIAAGVDAFRLNFSHGTLEWHEMVYHRIRQAAEETGKAIAIVQDLQGPKIRLGEIEGKGITLITGATTLITSCPIVGTSDRIPTSFTNLPSVVSLGNRILIDEGQIQLTVTEVKGTEIHCFIDIGGTLTSRKGMHIPGLQSKIPSLTDKDKEDARFGLSLGFDFIALSFVRRPEDVHYLRDWMHHLGCSLPIISKIETHEAVEHLEGIISASDGVMVARGDLGIETTLELIPYYQKKIIQLANSAGKLVITATQMLESMISKKSRLRGKKLPTLLTAFSMAQML
jgi:pyruvate kinase